MSFQTNLTEIRAIANEVNDIRTKAGFAYPEKEVTATSGRMYKVVNIRDINGDEKFFASEQVSEKMSYCFECKQDVPVNWTRFTYQGYRAHYSDRFIHGINHHAQDLLDNNVSMEGAKDVFLR